MKENYINRNTAQLIDTEGMTAEEISNLIAQLRVIRKRKEEVEYLKSQIDTTLRTALDLGYYFYDRMTHTAILPDNIGITKGPQE